MKFLILIALAIGLSGCGAFERFTSYVTGGGTETCVDGVLYLQFTSGASVKYKQDGSVVNCE